MKHMKCKICGFEAGDFNHKGECIECQNHIQYEKENTQLIENSFTEKIITFEKNHKKQPIQLELYEKD